MTFTLESTLEILERTPTKLRNLLSGLTEAWIRNNEGGETWSPYDVVGHPIIGERTDWMARTKIILHAEGDKTFVPFDRFTQFQLDKSLTINDLLEEFQSLRRANLRELVDLNVTEEQLDMEGIHPELGVVTLGQLLATWAVHDLSHLAQISRVMAKQYKENVSPWSAFIGLLDR